MIKAALFDLDGVVLDTETQYSVFWGMIGKEYHPELPDFVLRIKGQTLVQIYDKYFSDDAVFAHVADYQGVEAEQTRITRRLDEFELHMKYDYIVGFEAFVADLREHGVKCAVVTQQQHGKDAQRVRAASRVGVLLRSCAYQRGLCPQQARSRLLPQGCCLLWCETRGVCRTGRQFQRTACREGIGRIHPWTCHHQFA